MDQPKGIHMTIKANERTKKIQIKCYVRNIGDGQKESNPSTMGFHVKQEHRIYLGVDKKVNRRGRTNDMEIKKLSPGKVYTFPEDVALEYLKSEQGRMFLEEVYD
jgi:hypothetical protein